jgi:hypothetical protein
VGLITQELIHEIIISFYDFYENHGNPASASTGCEGLLVGILVKIGIGA